MMHSTYVYYDYINIGHMVKNHTESETAFNIPIMGHWLEQKKGQMIGTLRGGGGQSCNPSASGKCSTDWAKFAFTYKDI